MVYVVNGSGHDLRSAERFGKLKFITEGRVNIFATDRAQYEIAEKLVDFDKADFLLLCGTPLLNVLAIMCCLNRSKTVQVLLFNAKTSLYEIRELSMESTDRIMEGVCQKSCKDSENIEYLETELIRRLMK